MPRPYPREFREDVIRVARNREPGTRSEGHRQGLRDLRVVSERLAQGRRCRGRHQARRRPRPSTPRTESCASGFRLLEQENEVLRRAAAYLSQANLPGK